MNKVIQNRESIIQHPAVLAWTLTNSNKSIPDEIEILAEKEKSNVLRFNWTDTKLESVIAKGALLSNLKVEFILYTEILANYPVTTLDCLGIKEFPKHKFSWLFLEDAKTNFFDPSNKSHRKAGMRWLGLLHSTYLSDKENSLLPDKSLDYFSQILHTTKNNIIENSTSVHLSKENKILLYRILDFFDLYEKNWHEIRQASSMIPNALIHGDYIEENMRIQSNKTEIVAFDWEMAGWGIPIFDLGSPIVFTSTEEELQVYISSLGYTELLDITDLKYLLQIGRLFKLLIYAYWESLYLDSAWLVDLLKRMGYYKEYMQNVFTTLGWTYRK